MLESIPFFHFAHANYKQIQRFLAKIDPKANLLRLFQAEVPSCWAI